MEISSLRKIESQRHIAMPEGLLARWLPKGMTAVAMAALLSSSATSEMRASERPTAERQIARQVVEQQLPNGCVPDSFIFLRGYLKAHPSEAGQLLFMDLKDGKAGGHAVALYSRDGKVCFFDHELGEVETSLNPRSSMSELSQGVQDLYGQRIERAKQAIAGGYTQSPAKIDRSNRDACDRAVALLGESTMATPIQFDADGKRHDAVAFAADNRVWIYMPESGAANVEITKGEGFGALAAKAVRTAFPQAANLSARRPMQVIAAAR